MYKRHYFDCANKLIFVVVVFNLCFYQYRRIIITRTRKNGKKIGNKKDEKWDIVMINLSKKNIALH